MRRVAVCNSTSNIYGVTDFINVVDLGDGSATYFAKLGATTKSGTVRTNGTNAFIYGKDCIFLWADVIITLQRGASTFASFNTNTLLSKLGLANVQVITGAFTFQLTHTPVPIPSNVSPTFFTQLRQASAITILECANCASNPDVPAATPRLVALPGLAKFEKCWNFAQRGGSVTSIFVKRTAFVDFTATFAKLSCSPGQFQITNNLRLTSLGGLSNLNTTIRPGPTIFIVGNPGLTTAASVSQLKPLAGCPTSSVPSVLSSAIQIQTTSCTPTVRLPPLPPRFEDGFMDGFMFLTRFLETLS